MKYWLAFLIPFVAAALWLPRIREAKSAERLGINDENVILITLDGVRWQEFFAARPRPALATPELKNDQSPVFPLFWKKFAKQGVIYGDPETNNHFDVSNGSFLSLPGYQSIMSGRVQTCATNDCPRISEETLQERLVREGAIIPRSVVSIASWEKIALATEHVEGATLSNAGTSAFPNLFSDPTTDIINTAQEMNKAWWFRKGYDESRTDLFTFTHAMDYLTKHRPRFMYIGLGDSDEYGHAAQYGMLVKTLRNYDFWINNLIETVDAMPDYGKKTTIIITTDHGRGGDYNLGWRDHGPQVPEARQIWLYARGPHVRPQGSLETADSRGHIDIRPTIEALMGLCPLKGEGRGSPLQEVTAMGRRESPHSCH